MKTKLFSITSLLSGAIFLLIVSCNNDTKNSNYANSDSINNQTDTMMNAETITPMGPQPTWGPTIKPEMLAVIEKLISYQDKPVEELSAVEARKNHTPTDAVMDLIKERNIQVPVAKVDTTGKDIDVKGGKIHLRIYTPQGNNEALPVIVYYHGGGFVIADLDVYDASAKGLSEQTNAIVVSVAYRMGPEYKFPTAHQDAFAAYEWTIKNAGSLNGDPKRIAVAGESAGGNLATNVSIMARDKGIMMPVHQLLVYPVSNSDMNTASYKTYADAKPLNKAMMAWFVKNYLNNTEEAQNPIISIVNANLKGLPSTTIIQAEIDPLQSEGMLLAEKLKAANVKVDLKKYEGVTHEFFGMAAVVPEAKDAQAYAAKNLKSSFKK